MINLSFENMRYLTREDYKAMSDLKRDGVPDELIEIALKNTVERNKEGGDDRNRKQTD